MDRIAFLIIFSFLFQGSQLDYSKFLHNSQRHSSIACKDCHTRTQDNSPTPRFPVHDACSNCHLAQFVTPAVPMCLICHTETKSSKPPLRSFPAGFKENFNVKFDHAQHMSSSARPQNGCAGCHNKPLNRGVAHEQKSYAPSSTNSRVFRFAFSHANHGPRQRLQCSICHNLSAGAPQTKQVSSPSANQHFPTARGMNCATCHEGKRSFGGDLDFKACRRCHVASTFRMPL
jgi:hypothetical protein